MNKSLSIISIIICLLASSCSGVTDEPSNRKSTDDAFSSLDIKSPVGRSRSELYTTEGLEDIVISGFTSVENGNSMKLLFNSQLASLTGLQSGSVYVTRYEQYKIDIPLMERLSSRMRIIMSVVFGDTKIWMEAIFHIMNEDITQ